MKTTATHGGDKTQQQTTLSSDHSVNPKTTFIVIPEFCYQRGNCEHHRKWPHRTRKLL